MSMTTNITGGLYGPTEEEEKALRQLAVERARQAGAMEKAQAQAATERTDFAPGFGPKPTAKKEGAAPLSREMIAGGRALLAGQQLGTPDSYGGAGPLTLAQAGKSRERFAAGQQDFAQPIPVTRGMTTTYQGPMYGEELATPGQAAQAFRREQGAKYKGGDTDARASEVDYIIDEKGMARNVEDYTHGLFGAKPELFQVMPDGKPQIKPEFSYLFHRHLRDARGKPDKAIEGFLKDLEGHTQEQEVKKYLTPEGRAKAMTNFKATMGRDLSPDELRWLDNANDPATRQFIYQWATFTPPARPMGVQGQVGGPAVGQGAAPLQPKPPARIWDMDKATENLELAPGVAKVLNQIAEPFRQPLGIKLRPREERESLDYERRLKPLGSFY